MEGQVSFFDKPRVALLEDVFTLNNDFKKGTEWEVFMEQKEHWVIYHNSVYYHPYKEKCRKVD